MPIFSSNHNWIIFLFSFYFSVFCVRKIKTPSMRQRSNGKPSIPSFMSNLCTWHRPLSFPSKVCISLFGTGEKTGLTSMLVSYFHFIPTLIRWSHLIFLFQEYLIISSLSAWPRYIIVVVKGQLISKYPFAVIVWTKIPTKLFPGFLL